MLKSSFIQNNNFDDQTILLRADLNVPVENNSITDNTRLLRLIPTVQYLQKYNCKIVIISHFKQPKAHEPTLSLHFIIDILSQLLKSPIHFIDDCIGEKVENTIQQLPKKSLILLENLRFHKGEAENDIFFSKQLAKIADVYVNDAFSCCHRNHASIVKITELLPSFIGINLQNELHYLTDILEAKEKPVGAIIGGSKISTKIEILNSMIQKVDVLIIGGAIANNFLMAQNLKIGNSLYEKSSIDLVKKIIEDAEKHSCQIIAPIDHVVAKNITDQTSEIKNSENIEKDEVILDIGPKTIEQIIQILSKLKLILWNGPLGAFEQKNFNKGTFEVTKALSNLTQNNNLKSIVGGGDSIAAISAANLAKEDFTYVSTGGGALLQFLSGKILPGLKALKIQF